MADLRRGARLASVVLAGAAWLALTGSAQAGAREPVADFASTKLFLGTHGYTIGVSGSSDNVTVSATRAGDQANYSTQGTANAKTLRADFGNLGKVDLKFHAAKTTHPKPPPHCHGQQTVKKGVWKGSVKFKGEKAYTKGSAKKLKGTVSSGNLTCNIGGGNQKTYVVLNAGNFSRPGGFVTFSASKPKSGGKPSLSVIDNETKGAVNITRFGHSTGQASDFTYDPGYTHATVKGSGPFSGTATFDQPGDGGEWTGNLSVKLPGATVALTGSGFAATLSESKFKRPAGRS